VARKPRIVLARFLGWGRGPTLDRFERHPPTLGSLIANEQGLLSTSFQRGGYRWSVSHQVDARRDLSGARV
jgi:hypothetical protein